MELQIPYRICTQIPQEDFLQREASSHRKDTPPIMWVEGSKDNRGRSVSRPHPSIYQNKLVLRPLLCCCSLQWSHLTRGHPWSSGFLWTSCDMLWCSRQIQANPFSGFRGIGAYYFEELVFNWYASASLGAISNMRDSLSISSSESFSIGFIKRYLDFLKYFRNLFESLFCSFFLTRSIAQ